MPKRFLGLALAVSTIAAAAAAAPPPVKPVRAAYNDALAREQAVRSALSAPDALATILIDVRAVTAAYEALFKRYATSGYGDDALWNGGRLALDAYIKFGQAQDRDTANRLLNKLAATYPTSKFAKQVHDQLARFEQRSAESLALPVGRALQVSQTDTPASQGDRIATIRDIRRTVTPESVRITIELDGEVAFHDERIGDPDRVFLDLTGSRAAPNLVDRTLRFESDDNPVRQVRVGRHPNHTTRVVLDANGIGGHSVSTLTSPFRIVIDCVRTQEVKLTGAPGPKETAYMPPVLRSRPSTREWVKAYPNLSPKQLAYLPPVLPSRPSTHEWVKAYPNLSPRATARIASAMEPAEPVPSPMAAAPTAPTTPTATPTTPPVRSAQGGVSIARQLGLGVSRIVIDPGHGGHDPGARGRGVTEAELVLDVSQRLQKLLENAGIEVILTRTTDEFVPLQERPAIANRENADLFLSIHANASPTGMARGIETYFLNFANNPNAEQVAARENAASALSMGTLPDMVKAIALNNKVDESRDFAGHVQHAMVERLRTSNKTLKDLGVKQAPFIVLIGATMPSVLAEISFVTNPQEAKLLKSNPYRQKIAEALFNAIRKYQTSLRSVQTVAHQ